MAGAKLPRATHEGVLVIGEIRIPCAVLSDRRRVISRAGMLSALGVAESQGDVAVHLPEGELIRYVAESGRVETGFPADALRQVCDMYLGARREGRLPREQHHIAERCEDLLVAFAMAAVAALADEASGHQKVRAPDALQRHASRHMRGAR